MFYLAELTTGDVIGLMTAIVAAIPLLFGIFWYLITLAMKLQKVNSRVDNNEDWLKRTSKKTDSTNKIVRVMYLNQVRIMDKEKIKPVASDDSSVDLPSIDG